MNKICNEAGVKWLYEKSGYGFTFIFYRVTENRNNVYLDVTLDGLNDLEIEALNLIKTNPKITREEIGTFIKKNIRTVQRITNSLVSKGFLIKVGNNRFGYWEVLK